MSVLGIDEISYGADDLAACRQFFLDWGLSLVDEQADRLVFETLNGCRVIVAATNHPDLPPAIEPGPTLREVVWGVESEADLALYADRIRALPGFVQGNGRIGCTDPNGLAVRLQLTQKRDVQMQSAEYNTWDRKGRINQASPAYERAQPIEVGHVVFFVKDVQACERFYVENFGFAASDRYPERGAFLRTAPDGGHHDIFLLQRPDKHAGLNHVAFTVRDIHEVFGGGMHISRCGWDTQLGPGRHPVSSAYFWYFKNPAGALVEYYADEDQLTADWQPREFEPGPTVFAEWAIDGGLDGNTRRQKGVGAADGKFLTDKK
ncbi:MULTISPECIES: VOC family protein [Comamonas]|uniref:Manganese-dependent 2,3-dihydroxybiphenyl 1,2-dioxygenase n=1 Tax=Comamonas testosteroni TaxID=285 RepID=A0A8B4RZY3_COMTE|nr:MULTISPECIES: VOC family protein [Comamonas]EHN67838.1 glyoxalase/bleomycin resistance protein [Comamonas testosteroni ATCC 11996]QQN71247.1 VOC family protein [Comamonas testosteroni]RDI11795.1 catechol-2,3-dioxygenase [Comamonas sp. AG1104]SUY74632.1 Manganese-dependent 2,3-dihydroxybiphenyl 1,2-dioxygenase [Comamonas testosteroni]